MLIIIIIAPLVYLCVCCLLYDGDYIRYMVKTWLLPFAAMSIGWLCVDINLPLLVAALIGGISFVLNLVFFYILRLYNRFSLPDFSNIGNVFKSDKQKKYSNDNEKNPFENEDAVRIKKLMAEISFKIDGLKKYIGDIEDKKRDFREIAIKTIRTAYGSSVSNFNYADCFSRYDEIKEDFSENVDPLIVAQCDKSVENANQKIAKADETIKSNKADIKKYQKMSETLQKQYEKELKIQEIKKLNNGLNEISDDEQDNLKIATKEMDFNQILQDFNTLNNEIEVRRDVEIQYGLIDI